MSVRLYVGNLSKDIEREEFESLFADYQEDLVSVKLISDKKTGKCRGFGFVTVKTDEKADELVEKFNGYTLGESAIKVEKALPRSKGKADGSEESGDSSGRRRKGGAKKTVTASQSAGAAAQPDPRWADELEKLKQLLATQTTGS